MADEGHIIRGINWRQTFPFVNIFRSFRIAIHPSKLFLGLALLLTVYFGGRILDWVWPVRASAIPGEIDQYERISSGREYQTLDAWRTTQQQAIDAEYAQDLLDYKVDVPAKDDVQSVVAARQQAADDAAARHKVDEVQDKITARLHDDVAKTNQDFDAAAKTINDAFNKSDHSAAASKTHTDELAAATRERDLHVTSLYDTAAVELRRIHNYRGMGLFESFFNYEIRQVTLVVDAVVLGRWLTPGGVKDSIFNFLSVGPVWLISYHTVFAILFGLLFLFAWSLFGGAISRIAAVHVAREEKISVRQAMNFAVGKFLSFASAPVIPILCVVAIGLLLAAVSFLVGNLPFVGPILIGVFFFLALLGGFIMTLALLGTAGGFNLMYPTVAVEGSDSFDAVSRSFSYIYARPWRMLFYTAVAITYGAATYLFIHLFIWMILMLTNHFVSMGIMTKAADGRDLLSVMWPSPNSAGRLAYQIDHLPLSAGQDIGARFIQVWVMLLVSFLGAFAISLYFSANTIIYFLMRSEVDATELDDVYLEQSEEDFGETAPVTVAVTATVDAPAPPPDAPPAT